jgi:carboxylesterase
MLGLLASGAVLSAVGAAYVYRTVCTLRHERELAARFRLGPDGVVEGAHGITLTAPAPARVALLLHGFGDTPQTLTYLARYLHERGWTVEAPLLPGHGRLLHGLTQGRAGAWISAARDAYRALIADNGRVAVIGLSMGGALATILAAEESTPPALVLLAPYLSMPRRYRIAARTYRFWAPLIPYVRGRGERSVRDERERALSLSPGITTGRLLRELQKVTERAQQALPRLRCPTLVIHSREDNRIPPDAAERNFLRIGAEARELVWRDGTGHVITVDYGREEIFATVAEWLDRYVPAAPPFAPSPGR